MQAGVLIRNPDNPGLPTNSPRTHYALSDDALVPIRAYGSGEFRALAEEFRELSHGGLAKRYARERELEKIPVTLSSGEALTLSPGKHNDLQREIVEEFLPRFAPGAQLMYLGDTDAKTLFRDDQRLLALGVPVDSHDKLPDVVAFDPRRGWLFLCEAVTSHGPVSPKRHMELENYLSECKVQRVYVSAFPDFQEYKRHADSIAWETEVWVAEVPTHLLHYDGEKFISPSS